jgi:hypothetical protein
MPYIEMPEVAYLYRYLLVSARKNTPEYGPILGYFAVTGSLKVHAQDRTHNQRLTLTRIPNYLLSSAPIGPIQTT